MREDRPRAALHSCLHAAAALYLPATLLQPERFESAPHAYSAHDIASTGCSVNATHRLQRHQLQPADRTHRLWFGQEKVAACGQQGRRGVLEHASKVQHGFEVWPQVLSFDRDFSGGRMDGRMDGYRRASQASLQHPRACEAETLGEQHRAQCPSATADRPWTGQRQSNLMGRLARLHGQQQQLLEDQLELFRCIRNAFSLLISGTCQRAEPTRPRQNRAGRFAR